MNTDLVVPDDATFQRFLAAADDGQLEQNPDQVSVDIIARILKADTVDDVLGGGGATHARDYLDTPFKLLGVHFNKSGIDGSPTGFYAVLDAVDSDGAKLTITCGAKNVIAQAWKLVDMDAVPIDVELKQSAKPTANGYHVMWLEKAGADF